MIDLNKKVWQWFFGKEDYQKGWHPVRCACGHYQGRVFHYGGTKRVPVCSICKDKAPDECIDCYLVNTERKKAGYPPLKRGRDYTIDRK